jgi:glyoxylase-like metal-dependent hydrolase (beta-lactamase superfamily II)
MSRTESRIDWTALSDGWTDAPEGVVLHGAPWGKRVRFHAVAFLLRHPRIGPVLVDSGYSSRFHAETRRLPGSLYGRITQVTLSETGGVAARLEGLGISREEVRHVVITHFHADHIGGLRDFPEARFHCSRLAWESVKDLRGLAAVRHGFLPGLLPEDFADRLSFVEEGAGELFACGSLRTINLPGHAPGQIGLRFTGSDSRPVLLAADACWTSEAFRQNRMPHPVTRLLHDWDAYAATLRRLHELHLAESELRIVPTHCPETALLLSD